VVLEEQSAVQVGNVPRLDSDLLLCPLIQLVSQ
jgi:hypothetical protein